MTLKKSICKKCRIKEFGKDGWNEFAEAWFDPVYEEDGRRYRGGTTSCPRPIFDRLKDSITKKVLAIATTEEKAVLDKVIFIKNLSGSWTVSSEEGEPPVWCPYRKEHIKYTLPPKRRKRNKTIK